MVCLKPCDTYSFNQLLKEHRVDRDKAYIVGVGCKGKLDIERIKKQGIKGIESIEGAEISDEAETLKIQTIYGEKEFPFNDALLERGRYVREMPCLQGQRAYGLRRADRRV